MNYSALKLSFLLLPVLALSGCETWCTHKPYSTPYESLVGTSRLEPPNTRGRNPGCPTNPNLLGYNNAYPYCQPAIWHQTAQNQYASNSWQGRAPNYPGGIRPVENHDARNNGYGGDGYRNNGYRNDGGRGQYAQSGGIRPVENHDARNNGYGRDGYRNDGYRNDGGREQYAQSGGIRPVENHDARNNGYGRDGSPDGGYRGEGDRRDQNQYVQSGVRPVENNQKGRIEGDWALQPLNQTDSSDAPDLRRRTLDTAKTNDNLRWVAANEQGGNGTGYRGENSYDNSYDQRLPQYNDNRFNDEMYVRNNQNGYSGRDNNGYNNNAPDAAYSNAAIGSNANGSHRDNGYGNSGYGNSGYGSQNQNYDAQASYGNPETRDTDNDSSYGVTTQTVYPNPNRAATRSGYQNRRPEVGFN